MEHAREHRSLLADAEQTTADCRGAAAPALRGNRRVGTDAFRPGDRGGRGVFSRGRGINTKDTKDTKAEPPDNVATGLTSIARNVARMAIYVGLVSLPPVIANAIAVATLSIVNFFIVAASVAAVLIVTTGASAAPRSETIDAWNRYVADTEARLDRSNPSLHADAIARDIRAEGESIGVLSGTIPNTR